MRAEVEEAAAAELFTVNESHAGQLPSARIRAPPRRSPTHARSNRLARVPKRASSTRCNELTEVDAISRHDELGRGPENTPRLLFRAEVEARRDRTRATHESRGNRDAVLPTPNSNDGRGAALACADTLALAPKVLPRR